MKRISIHITGREILEAAIFIACAWGKASWVWFWIVFFLNELNGFAFRVNAEDVEE